MADEPGQSDSPEIIQETNEATNATNLKVLSDGPAFYQNMAYANAVANQQLMTANMAAHQQGMNALYATIIGKITESVIATSPTEGGADAASLQILSKLAQTTRPETGRGE